MEKFRQNKPTGWRKVKSLTSHPDWPPGHLLSCLGSDSFNTMPLCKSLVWLALFRLFERTFVLMTGSNENKSLWLQHKRLQSKRQSTSSPMTSGLTWHSRGMSTLAQSWASPLQLLLTLPSRDVCSAGNRLLLHLNSFHTVNFQLRWLGSGITFLKFSFCSNITFLNWGDSSRLCRQTSRSDLWLQNWDLRDHGPGLQAWGRGGHLVSHFSLGSCLPKPEQSK